MWVYILECADGSYYTGWTNDIYRRYKAHQSGRGAKYTRSHYPLRIVYLEYFEEKTEAMRREYEIKQKSRKEKERLIALQLKKKTKQDIIRTGGNTDNE